MSKGLFNNDHHKENLNEEKLKPFLESTLNEIFSHVTIQRFPTGMSNPTFLITTDKQTFYVLRKQPAHLLDKSAHDLRKEFFTMKCLFGKVPVPQVYVYSEDLSIVGTTFYLMSFVQGRIFHNVLLLEIEDAQRVNNWLSLIKNLALLHKQPVSLLGDRKISKRSFYSRQINVLRKITMKQASVIGTPAFSNVSDLLNLFEKEQCRDIVCIVHGDYKMDNVVFDYNSSDILAILDWELSTVGHPFSDLSNLILPFYIEGKFASLDGLKNLDGSDRLLELLVTKYSEYSGFSISDKERKFCVAFSFFRMAVILQGVAARANLVSCDNAKPLGKAALKSYEMACETIGKQDSKL